MIIRLVFLFLLTLCSCSSSHKEGEQIRVSILRGPSAIAFAGWMENPPVIDGKPLDIQVIDAPDKIQALLVKGETDIAALPMISAANLYNRGISFHLLGCPVWGTLYMAGRQTYTENKAPKPELYLFGAGTTPDILTRYYLQQNRLDYKLNYTFSTAPEILQGLLAGKIETAVLGEPFLSMALRKDSTLRILADLNNQGGASPGFPQTAIVCSPALADKSSTIDSLLQVSCRFATEYPEETIRILEKQGIFKPGMLTPEGIERCRIHYQPASEAKGSIATFLQLIESYEPKALNGKLPDGRFYIL